MRLSSPTASRRLRIAGTLRSISRASRPRPNKKAPNMPVTIDYYISLNSPWTFMGSALLAEIAKRNGATVNVKPAKFHAIFEKTGGLPLPKRSPERRAYRLMELKRWREVRNLPLVLQPKYSPSDDAAATRLVIAAKLQGKDAHRLATEFGRALWELDEPLGDSA